RFEPLAQFADDFLKARRVKDVDGFRERAQGHARTTKSFLHILEFARLLQAAQRSEGGVEKEMQTKQAVLIEVQLAVVRGIAFATDRVQALQQRTELIEVLQAMKNLGAHQVWLLLQHGIHPLSTG